MSRLRALVEEVDTLLEIHLAGRSTTRFNRVAYVLTDDAVELASKLYLSRKVDKWSDAKPTGGHKGFRFVTKEVRDATGDASVARLLDAMDARRDHRNGFFHSTKLLELTVNNARVNEALVDVLDLCALLFDPDWGAETPVAIATAAALVRLDHAASRHPALPARVEAVLAAEPRHGKPTQRKTGCATVAHPADQHAVIAVRHGGAPLRDRLLALLPPP